MTTPYAEYKQQGGNLSIEQFSAVSNCKPTPGELELAALYLDEAQKMLKKPRLVDEGDIKVSAQILGAAHETLEGKTGSFGRQSNLLLEAYRIQGKKTEIIANAIIELFFPNMSTAAPSKE